ncbi:MAG: hypothetical protein SGARI_003623 [Bacillariaceae sp.]
MSKLLVSSVIAAVIGVLAFQLGVFDRPEFHYYENIWWPDGLRKQRAPAANVAAPPLYAVMVATNTKDIAGNVERLLTGVNEPLSSADDDAAKEAMAKAAQEYGAPEGAESLSVGLYFDDPSSVELEKFKDIVAAKFELDASKQEQVRAVRVGPGPVLKARIPWRNMLTPAIAPMFHWKRAFQQFYDGEKEGKYSAANGRNNNPTSEDASAVSCEIYVTGKNDSMEYLHYVVLMGDTSVVWDDTFPQEDGKEEESQTEVPETPPLEASSDKQKVA